MGLNYSTEVEEWLVERDHPLNEAMRAARDVILGADERITECIKWKTPTFMFEGNIVSFNPSKKLISLMFHRGSEIPGNHPRLEGDGKLVRTMRFHDVSDVQAGADDLAAVIGAWCDWKQS